MNLEKRILCFAIKFKRSFEINRMGEDGEITIIAQFWQILEALVLKYLYSGNDINGLASLFDILSTKVKLIQPNVVSCLKVDKIDDQN